VRPVAPGARAAVGASRGRRLVWRVERFLRRRRRQACQRLYRDRAGDCTNSIVVAGTGRSGTTWLAEILAADLRARVLFEPFHAERVEDLRGYPRFLYRRPEQDDPRLEAFARRVLSGRIRDPWVDSQVDVLFPHRRVVKEIRACLFLRWLADRFPQVPVLLVIRHPCAVVASRLRLRWDTDRDLQPFLEQDFLVADHLREHLDTIRSASTDVEKHAVVWCVHHLVPLRQFRDGGLRVIFYEELCRDPAAELAGVFEVLGRRPGPRALRAARRFSMTAVAGSAVVTGDDPVAAWRRHLRNAQIAEVLGIVEAFGLGDLYAGSHPRPQAVAHLRGRGPER
jgi:hypothetical protein